MSSQLHIIEPGGQGGVYQSVLGSIQAAGYVDYDSIILHTARDSEMCPHLPRVHYCRCMRWQRRGPKLLRSCLSLIWSSMVLLPHLVWSARMKDVEIQGQFGNGFYAAIAVMLRLSSSNLVFTPHNCFTRGSGSLAGLCLSISLRVSNEVVFYNHRDFNSFSSRRKTLRPLVMYVPSVVEGDRNFWKSLFRDTPRNLVGFVGQIRSDKNPNWLVEAMINLGIEATVVFAGEDKGGLSELNSGRLLSAQKAIVLDEYIPLPKLVALIELLDVVVCPYSLASQSGVAALCKQLGTAVVATDIGGLAEQADVTFSVEDDPIGSLAQAIRMVLDQVSGVDGR